MPHPSVSQFENAIVDNVLNIDNRLIVHPAFLALLKVLKQRRLIFNSVKILPEKGTNNITIEGESSFFSTPLKNSEFYVFEEPDSEHEFEFEWHGTLPATTFEELYKNGIMLPDPLNVITELINGSFSEVDMLYTSNDMAFAIEVGSSNIKYELPEIGLSLDKPGFYYERSLDKRIKTVYRLYSNIKIGSTTIPTIIELPAGNAIDRVCWSLKTTNLIILNDGLRDIISFLSGQKNLNGALGNDLMTLLPDAVNAIKEFALTKLIIHFNPQTKFLQLLDFSIQSVKPFELVPGFSLSDIGVSGFITFLDNKISYTPGLFGRFMFSDTVEAGLSIQLPLNPKENWRIEMDGSIDLDRLQDLETFPFLKLSDLNIPPEWLIVKDIHMDNLHLIFNPAEGKLKKVDLSLQLSAESSIIPGIKVSDPYLEFSITLN